MNRHPRTGIYSITCVYSHDPKMKKNHLTNLTQFYCTDKMKEPTKGFL